MRGFSLGGTAVLSAAAHRPELVNGAAVLGTSSVVGRAAAEFHQRRAEQVGDAAAVLGGLRQDTATMLASSTLDVDIWWRGARRASATAAATRMRQPRWLGCAEAR